MFFYLFIFTHSFPLLLTVGLLWQVNLPSVGLIYFILSLNWQRSGSVVNSRSRQDLGPNLNTWLGLSMQSRHLLPFWRWFVFLRMIFRFQFLKIYILSSKPLRPVWENYYMSVSWLSFQGTRMTETHWNLQEADHWNDRWWEWLVFISGSRRPSLNEDWTATGASEEYWGRYELVYRTPLLRLGFKVNIGFPIWHMSKVTECWTTDSLRSNMLHNHCENKCLSGGEGDLVFYT